MPWASPWARPARTPSSTPAMWAGDRRPMYCRREPRGRYSMAMYGTEPSSKYSCTVTTLAWFIAPASRDSSTNRSAKLESAR